MNYSYLKGITLVLLFYQAVTCCFMLPLHVGVYEEWVTFVESLKWALEELQPLVVLLFLSQLKKLKIIHRRLKLQFYSVF